MPVRERLLAAALAGAAGMAGGGATPPPPAPPGHVEWGTYARGGDERRWRLYVPVRAATAGAAPLLVLLHGCTQDAEDLARGTRMDDEAERAGMLVLYPEQPSRANQLRCWNWFDPAHQTRDDGEPALLAALIAEVASTHGVDARRVHVAGVSAGGAMALLLAANYPERFASAASLSGVPLGVVRSPAEAWQVMRTGAPAPGPSPDAVRAMMGARARAVPLLVVHGAADATVIPANGRQTAAQWAAATNATPAGETRVEAHDGVRAHTETRWRDASGRDVVELVEIEGLGHAWSGGSSAGTYSDPVPPSASAMLAAWVARHALPEGAR